MPGCAGLITMNYKLAIARVLVEDLLPRVGEDALAAQHHMQRALNALVAPGTRATNDLVNFARTAGYNEIGNVVGNPVHGIGGFDEGLGIIPHLKYLGESDSRAKDAAKILELARDYADNCIKTQDASMIKRGGRVVANLLRAATEMIT